MGLEEVAITANDLLYIFGFIASAWGVIKIYKEWQKPKTDLVDKVETHEDLLKKYDERLDRIEGTDKLALQSLLVLINHAITGNGIEQLKDARDDLQKFLINK